VLTAESKARGVSVSFGGGSGDTSGTRRRLASGSTVEMMVTSSPTRGDCAHRNRNGAQPDRHDPCRPSIADAGGTGDSTLTGSTGGAGDDTVVNTGAITLTPTANASGQNLSVSVNASVADANALATAIGVGLAGGDGQDDVTNAGAVNATAAATTAAISVGAHLLGGVNTSNITADAAVTGVDGGNDDDQVFNSIDGNIHARATATTTAVDVSITGIGVTNGEVQTTPVAKAVGLDGGTGHDLVVNDGKIDVSATATSTSTRASVTVGGSAGAKAGTTALVTAAGLAGGQGDDVLIHNGLFNDVPPTICRSRSTAPQPPPSTEPRGLWPAVRRATRRWRPSDRPPVCGKRRP
jgi:hypothetical protein